MQPRRLPVVLVIALAGLVGACSSAAATASPGAPAATVATVAPTSVASVGPAAMADVGAAAGSLANLHSYKITMQVIGTSAANVEIIAVNGTPPARMVTTTTGSKTVRIIEIGDDVWLDAGSGTFIKGGMTKTQADQLLAAFDLGAMLANLNKSGDLSLLQNMGVEQKNGVNATHYHGDQNTPLPPGASPIPAGAVGDVWLAVDGGYLVALEATGFGGATTTDVKIEVTNINDPTLSVTAPS